MQRHKKRLNNIPNLKQTHKFIAKSSSKHGHQNPMQPVDNCTHSHLMAGLESSLPLYNCQNILPRPHDMCQHFVNFLLIGCKVLFVHIRGWELVKMSLCYISLSFVHIFGSLASFFHTTIRKVSFSPPLISVSSSTWVSLSHFWLPRNFLQWFSFLTSSFCECLWVIFLKTHPQSSSVMFINLKRC